MSAGFQHFIVILIVAAAAVYLGRAFWKTFAARTGCGCAGKSCARMEDMTRRISEAGKGRRLDVETGRPVSSQNEEDTLPPLR